MSEPPGRAEHLSEHDQTDVDSTSPEARVAGLAQAFSERHRRGEWPTIEEYAAQYPELAAEIRELFPLLCVLEDLGPAPPEPERATAGPHLGPLERLGEYRIIRELGRGGMGVVYEAEQETLRRRVAIKVLPYHAFSEKHQLERFRVEAQAAARLHHTNIVPVFGVGEDRGVHYYVMQFIRGQTLAGVLKEVRRLRATAHAAGVEPDASEECSALAVAQTLFSEAAEEGAPQAGSNECAGDGASMPEPPSDSGTTTLGKDSRAVYFRSVAQIGLEAAEGLAYAHNEGILHRDIKPSNLLLDLRGTVWITDFGLAKVVDSGELTASDGVVGTIRYMAPERFNGAGDAKSDVYGLGITLYELLTLRPAFATSDRAEMLRAIAACAPPPPRRIDPAVPRDLETIVLKAMAREPQDRYASAAALADDLRRFLNREPVSARRARVPERLWRWCQRNPALAGLSGAVALLLVALAAGGVVYAVNLRGERERTFERLVASKLEEGRAWRWSGKPGSRRLSLAALREAVTPATVAEVRNQVITSLALCDLEVVVERDLGGAKAFTDSHLERLALLSPGGDIHVYATVEAPEPLATLPSEGGRSDSLRLSPGGRYLAVIRKGERLLVWDATRGEQLFEAAGASHSVAFDASGRRCAHTDKEGGIVVRALPGGDVERRLDEKTTGKHLAFDPGGRRLAADSGQNMVQIHDIASGKVVARLFHPHYTSGMAWHPGGKRLAVGCWDYKVYVWDVESEEPLQCLAGGHRAEVSHVAFSHRGHVLASTGWDNRTLLWSTESGELLADAAGTFSAFSFDDSHLGFTQGTRGAGVWRIAGGEVLRFLRAPQPRIGKGPARIDISSDGRWLGASCASDGARLWAMGALEEAYHIAAGTVHCVRFHPDSSALWTGAAEGLFRWPLRRIEDSAEWTLGPPLEVSKDATRSVSLSRDGRLLATLGGEDRIVIRDLEVGGGTVCEVRHTNASHCEISPSGRWLVSATFQGRDVRVWDTRRSALIHSFDTGTAVAVFSPDERWLATGNGPRVTIYETSGWKERLRIPREDAGDMPGRLAFSADSRYLALALSRSLLSLYDMGEGCEVARFEGPLRPMDINDLAISPDNGLLAAAVVRELVQVWDLRRIRSDLTTMGLDWSPEARVAEPRPPESLRLRIDLGGLSAGVMDLEERRQEANQLLDLLTRRVQLDPSAEAFAARAWAFTSRGNLQAALTDLDRVLELSPGDGQALVRRAAVLAGLGRLKEASDDCERALALSRPPPDGVPALVRSTVREALRVRARVGMRMGIDGLEGAWRDWKELAGLEPDDLEVCENIAFAWILRRCRGTQAPAEAAAGDAELALRSAEKDWRARAENRSSRRNLGAVLYHLGRLEEARSHLEGAWLADRRLYSAALHLAMIAHRGGEPKKARALFDTATAEGPGALGPGTAGREFLECMRTSAERVLQEPTGVSPTR